MKTLKYLLQLNPNAKVICFCLMIAYQTGWSQQHPIFSQYMFNGLVINPAYAGSHGSMEFTATARKQWAALRGAPQTQVLTMNAPIGFTRSSAGIAAIHDELGVTNQYNVYGIYAYRIPVSKRGRISVGGQGGFTFYNSKLSDLDIVTENDQVDVAFGSTESRFLPNLGLGIYYYDDRSYIGLSIPTLINNRWNIQDPTFKATQERHYFLSAGHVFDVGPTLKLKPNVLIRWVEGGPFQFDLNANLLIQKALWVGVSYRMQDAIDALIEFNINEKLSIGYSYGYSINKFAAYEYGTHEFLINYRLRKAKDIVVSPRYF